MNTQDRLTCLMRIFVLMLFLLLVSGLFGFIWYVFERWPR